ncbi:NEQ102 [Nanoarchaeum equitans Kin4-M]|uniref:Histidine--tRNA ligase n=1 Tax=Nanoarchaeum equitans (strain Kin4-M) TaxID=228908 RepID=SYH_NANEQ|nr:RecName: Full=Histidine--tRNA ligase; AltName: Full=Histidyl-tRNA synthetase; Short=HisRS [Nanoarchaeum equitans Kin4-M]AAR38959.1 NEQ102 [Nanoarchaeum equitans Kin4-M]
MILPPRGTKDFTPELAILWKEIVSKIESVYQKYGFDPIITPIVEYWDTLKGKYGEEAEKKEIWRFRVPQSKKWYALKYDQTVPLARYFARFRPKLPFKRYTIDRTFRYDEPQKGRYREFWQADADIVGSPYPEADAEILNMMIEAYETLGFNVYLRVSDRRALESLIEKVGEKDKFIEIARIIDKWDKIGEEGVLEKLKQITDKAEKIIELLKENPEEFYPKEFWEIIDLVEKKNKIKIDIKLARGFDYYTGMVYEVWIEGFNRALGGGGRYDNLIGIFSKEKIPAVGGSIGINPLIDVGLEKGIFNLNKKTYTQIAVIYIEVFKEAWRIANKLRDLGLNVYIDLLRRDFKKQMEYVIEKDIRYLVIVGKKDLANNLVTFQDRLTRERKKIPIENLEEIKSLVQ